MRYTHREARRDIRFIFSEMGLKFVQKANELFKKVYNSHLLDRRRNKNKGKPKTCERCFKYFFKMSDKFAKERRGK